MGGDADGDADVEADADADADADGDADGASHGVSIGDALAFLGFGRVPVMMWIEILLITWGASGLFASLAGAGWWGARGIAAASAIAGTGLITRGLARILPDKVESDSLGIDDLVGLSGRVTSTVVTETAGEGVFDGRHSHAVYLPIRIEGGGAALSEHSAVVVIDVDSERGIATVMSADRLAGSIAMTGGT
jgi:hypothetical protein